MVNNQTLPDAASLSALLANISNLPESDLRDLNLRLQKLEKLKDQEVCKERFIKFVKRVWPTFVDGRHHVRMAAAFERVARGEIKRLIINMQPLVLSVDRR